jgi:hypothetical protein
MGIFYLAHRFKCQWTCTNYGKHTVWVDGMSRARDGSFMENGPQRHDQYCELFFSPLLMCAYGIPLLVFYQEATNHAFLSKWLSGAKPVICKSPPNSLPAGRHEGVVASVGIASDFKSRTFLLQGNPSFSLSPFDLAAPERFQLHSSPSRSIEPTRKYFTTPNVPILVVPEILSSCCTKGRPSPLLQIMDSSAGQIESYAEHSKPSVEGRK